MMKKFLAAISVIIMTCFVFKSNAQILSRIEGMPPYKLGITVGMNNSWFSFANYESVTGFQAGLNLMLDGSTVVQNTYGRIEAKYSMKGAYLPSMGQTFKTHYVEIPVHVGYAWYLNENLSLLAEAGPYFAVGLAGERKFVNFSGMHTETFFGDLEANRFDFGGGVQIGAMLFKDYQIHAAFDWGFVNMKYVYQQNRNISVGISYFFE